MAIADMSEIADIFRIELLVMLPDSEARNEPIILFTLGICMLPLLCLRQHVAQRLFLVAAHGRAVRIASDKPAAKPA